MLDTFGSFIISKIAVGALISASPSSIFIGKLIIIAEGNTLPFRNTSEIFPLCRAGYDTSLTFVVRILIIMSAIVNTSAFGPIAKHVGFSWAIIQVNTSIGDIILDQTMRKTILHTFPQTIPRINHCIPPIRAFPNTVISGCVDVLIRIFRAISNTCLIIPVSVKVCWASWHTFFSCEVSP